MKNITDYFSYDRETGFVKKIRATVRSNGRLDSRNVGVVFEPSSDGYVRFQFEGKKVLAHRFAWFAVHGAWPEKQIDHKNGNRSDNRIQNLRLVDHRGNAINRHTKVGRDSDLPIGITRTTIRGVEKFQVSCYCNGKRKSTQVLSLEKAIEKRKQFEEELFC